jgi:hypothetical protein
MPMRKISVTVDADVLEDLLEQEGESVNLSAIVNEALAARTRRRRFLTWLDEMDRKHPPTPEDIAAGHEIWRRTEETFEKMRPRRKPNER